MKQSSTRSTLSPTARVALQIGTGTAAALLAAALAGPLQARAQDAAPAPAAAAQAAPADATPAAQGDLTLSNQKPGKKKKVREESESKKDQKIVASKDTKKNEKKNAKAISLTGMDTKLPDKALFDKAQDAIKHGKYDVGRIDLQTLLNTYPESQYMMQSKLAIADSWYKEGGSAALTQAEQEYKDFITFFPNAPEAAEAQMRVGDIYFRQMDKPDRDYTKTQQAEQEYRLMLQQFPDSPLVPQAKQRLREVQETMAGREAGIAEFYASRLDWSAAVARYQTIVDSYPLYSRMDEVLIAIGDQYESLAKNIRDTGICSKNEAPGPHACLPEDTRARLLKVYDDQAQAAYDSVILQHGAAPHVEDAKDRLVGMNLPVPTPTPDQMAASAALENSRGQYTLSKRAFLLFAHSADTVPAATIGDPLLEDPKATLAPEVLKRTQAEAAAALNPAAAAAAEAAAKANAAKAAAPTTDAEAAPAPAAAPVSNAPLTLENVPSATAGSTGNTAIVDNAPASTPSSGGATGSGVGIEIVQPNGKQAPVQPGNTSFPGDQNQNSGGSSNGGSSDNGGVKAVGPTTAQQLAPVEHANEAPTPINEVKPGSQPQTTPAADATKGKKNPKPVYDADQESSSKHKPKKGLKKINPF